MTVQQNFIMNNTELIKIWDLWKYGCKPIGNVLDAIQEYAEEYHQSELLKLNKSDVISSVCISCDEHKYTHDICIDCINKLILENKQTDL